MTVDPTGRLERIDGRLTLFVTRTFGGSVSITYGRSIGVESSDATSPTKRDATWRTCLP